MEQKIVFIGLDVDDKNFHGAYLSRDRQIKGSFKTRPNVGSLVKKIKELEVSGYEIEICYEATHIGFSLLRDLKKHSFECSVISPNHIPKVPGSMQKTDRLDAERLAEFFSAGLLQKVFVPSEKDEAIRSLIRSRDHVTWQIRRVKLRILGLCRVSGLHYREASKQHHQHANHWTQRHLKWLDSQIKNLSDPAMKMNFNLLMMNLNQLEEIQNRFDVEIQKYAEEEPYRKSVKALEAFRGISTLSALTIVVELADIKRFDHPKRLTSFAGLDIREYSSGGRENKFGISKMGNKYIRNRIVEASQNVFRPPKVGKPLLERRKDVDEKIVQIADRCMLRLHSKAFRLLHRGKNRNTIKVACAREMLGFIWEALQVAS